jgi:hypothetical protein
MSSAIKAQTLAKPTPKYPTTRANHHRTTCCRDKVLPQTNVRYLDAPRSPQRTPDFLSANLMRLSLMKAAHADVGGAPWQEIRVRGPKKTGRSPSNAFTQSTTHLNEYRKSNRNKSSPAHVRWCEHGARPFPERQCWVSRGPPRVVDFDSTSFPSLVIAATRPTPILRPINQSPLHRVPMYVVELLHPLSFCSHVEVIVPSLPEGTLVSTSGHRKLKCLQTHFEQLILGFAHQ